MPVYFAYGSNLDRQAMTDRCPLAIPLGLGTLDRHRFFIMANGYASVRTAPDATVHGLLWQVPDRDMPALDAYEEVDAGLYRRATVPIDRPGDSTTEALIYLGLAVAVGRPTVAYMGAIIAAAAGLGLPTAYRDELLGWMP